MLRYMGIYGGLSGATIAAIILAGIVLAGGGFFTSVVFGYLVMLVALAFVFVGVKRYRDVELGGVIRFWPALGLGLGISVVAGLIYAGVWEGYLASTNYAFMEHYSAAMLKSYEQSGMTGAELDAARQEMARMVELYDHFWFRVPMTIVEMLPAGVLVALVSAALLRNPKLLPARAPPAPQRAGG
ncbi:MAG TPA: DUF4199 domain-containing protein [Xanthomonadales bacterium]|nr:DUF4199 domain-containing protein [Xanthomonadales bacterium]